MKTIAAVGLMLVLGASVAGAEDIKGKWGIGAALFNPGFESSLIRGHSNRTAWVFDVFLSGISDDRTDKATSQLDVEHSTSTWAIGAGPALRRFFRPESDFSPYGDLFVFGNYQHRHDTAAAVGDPLPLQSSNSSNAGVSTGLRFGLEYFTRWHCSIAAHTDILQLRWDRFNDETEQPGVPAQSSTHENVYRASFGIAPRLLVRAYF